jgi:hypothetical protein
MRVPTSSRAEIDAGIEVQENSFPVELPKDRGLGHDDPARDAERHGKGV